MEHTVRVRVSEKGRLVIPAQFREALGIEPGDLVEVRLEDNGLRVATMQQRLRDVRRRLKKVFGPGRSLSGELIAERREAARRE
ncbi:MAG: AbrB/MazE/SpoVT family DNA-binding domain-containing protein [Acidobacteriaceae bacterium]|jgi:AbrB family looped-hinge helix DNA binding protein